AFSKEPDDLGHQLTLAFAYYHFVVPHRSLRQRLSHSLPTKGRSGSRKKWKPGTPAMATGLTDHVWTMDELLSFCVPPKHLRHASYTITTADAQHPAIRVRTVDRDAAACKRKHTQELNALTHLCTFKSTSLLNLVAPDCYTWSLYHLVVNEQLIKEKLFPITFYVATGAEW